MRQRTGGDQGSVPLEEFMAQAVAARSYALATRKTSGAFDLYPDVRSQVIEPEHRFFLALLMNAPTRADLLALRKTDADAGAVFDEHGYAPPFNPLRTSTDDAYRRQLRYVDRLVDEGEERGVAALHGRELEL